MTTKHSMPLTQHGQHHRQLSMMQASYPALTGTWLQWTATPDVLGCTTKRLARTERQFQHEQALCVTFEPLLHGSSISPQTDTCIKRNRPLVARQSHVLLNTCTTHTSTNTWRTPVQNTRTVSSLGCSLNAVSCLKIYNMCSTDALHILQ